MALTALDIQQQRFRTKVRGIDPKEVQTFLEQAAAAFEDLQRENHRLTDEVRQLRDEIDEHRKREGAFKRALMHSQKVLDQMTANAEKQADLIVLIVSTDLSSTTLTKTLLDYLRSKGIRDHSIFTILNRAVGLEGLSRADVEKALGIDVKTSFPYLVHFSLANNQHQPFSLKFQTETTAILAFRDVAERIAAAARQQRAAKEPQ